MESVIHNFDVFISYSRADYVDEQKNIISGNVISQIKEHFDKAGISYWMDETGIYCGDAWAEELAAKIEECSLFLFVSSENSNKSKWTRKELATAHMFDKTIIPFRVDESVYNKSVIMYIADLDYIDYYTNPTLAFNRLIDSILESKKKVEELIEQKHKEEQQLRRHEEQEQAKWVQEIESVCLEIEEFSSKSELARKKANHTLKKVSDKDKRIHLTNLINRSSSLFAKNLALVAEKQELQESIDDANTKLSELTSENETLLEQLNAAQSSLANAEAELKEIRSETERIGSGHTTNKPSKKRKQIKIFSIVAAVISLSLSLGCAIYFYDESCFYRYSFLEEEREYRILEDAIRKSLGNTPLFITDVEMGILDLDKDGNVVTAYGQDIYEAQTMYLTPKITYFGFVYERVNFRVKIFDSNGQLIRNEKIFPEGYGYEIYSGENNLYLTSWGNYDPGSWKAGKYRIEIWYKDTCLKSHKFRIRSGSNPER